MFGFGKKTGIQAQPATVSVALPVQIPLERRVARVKNLRAAIARGNGGPERIARLQSELDAHMEALLAHKAALEALVQ